MTLLRAAAWLGVCLLLQLGLGRLAPSAYAYLDLMMIPVVAYSIRRSQRSAMLMGCAAGLLQDAWFHGGLFGLNGFKKTLLGWLLGGLGSRFDLNQQLLRFVAGALISAGDSLLDVGLRRMLDLQVPALRPSMVLARAGITGLLVVVSFIIVDRVTGERRGMPRRRFRRA